MKTILIVPLSALLAGSVVSAAQQDGHSAVDLRKGVEELASRADPANDDWLTERLQTAAKKQLKHIGKVLTSQSWSETDLAAFVSSDARAAPLRPQNLKAVTLAGGITVVRSNVMDHQDIAIGDLNGDGLEDVYVAAGSGLPNKLLLQNPNGTMRNTAVEANVARLNDTKGVLFADMDNGGEADLYVASDFGRNSTYRNEARAAPAERVQPASPATGFAGRFVDVAAQADANDESLASRRPLPPPGFLSVCRKLITQRQTARARRLLEPVVADHPGWAKAHFYLGLTYHLEKRYERAAEWFKRSLQLDPLYHTPRVFYGWCLYYLGDPDASREMFESFLRPKPNYPDAIYALGLIDFDADDIESARVRFEKVIELAQKQRSAQTEAKARARLADVLIRTNKLKDAKEQLDKSIELNPNNYEPYYKLSRVLERLGDHEAAERARHKHDEVRERMHKTGLRDQGRVNE